MRIFAAAVSTALVALVAAGCKSKPARGRDAGSSSGSSSGSGNGSSSGNGSGSGTAIAAPPARSEHDVFVLADNRHAAHRVVDGALVLDGADIGFARYIRFGVPAPRWHLGQIVDGERAAVADHLASLEIPLTAAQAAAATTLTARVHGDDKQTVSIKINGRSGGKDARVALTAGWQEIQVPIVASRVALGENQIVLETAGGKSKLAVAWLRVGGQPPIQQERALALPIDPRAAATFDAKTGAIDLVTGASLAWYVTIPDGANLVADVAPGCRVEVDARAGDDSFAGGLLVGAGARVDLTAMTDKVVRLTLTARDCPRAHITAARITLHGPAPQLLPVAAPPRYVILWIMDALRADRVPVFTPGARAQVPNLEELAKTSAVFRQYYVQGNESQTSHSSIWTALYPAVHNVRLAGQGGAWRIDRKFDILGDQMTKAGLFTTAVTGNGFINDDGGYTRGFQEFRNLMREPGGDQQPLFGATVVDDALGQLDKHRDKPVFLFFGTIDNHSPWIGRHPWLERYSPGPYHGPFQDFASGVDLGFKPDSMGCSIIPAPEDIERLRAIYDSAISYDDQQVGRLVEALKSRGIWDQTMLIITADHGDELFEDTRCGHGGSLRDSLERVPLLIHDPARFPAGTIVDEGAEGVDLLPTILTALGVPVFPAAQGMPLEPLAQGVGRGWPRPSYASMYEYAHAMRIGRWKARVASTGTPIIDDLVADPGEKLDVAAVRPVERRMLTDNLGLFLALRTQWTKRAWGVTTAVTAEGAAALDTAATP